MSDTGKGKRKGKTKLTLDQFHAKMGGPVTTTPSRMGNWADETEELEPDDLTPQWPDSEKPKELMDRSLLPSAPRASTALNIDESRIPKKPPFTVFLGNLSYEVSEEDIRRFFEMKRLEVTSVRLITDKDGRLKGFGYAEFGTLRALMDALALSGENVRNRPLQIDIAAGKDDKEEGGYRAGYRGGREESDRTSGNWRQQREVTPPHRPPYGGVGRYSPAGGRDQADYHHPRNRSPPYYRDHSPRRDGRYRGHDDNYPPLHLPADGSAYRGSSPSRRDAYERDRPPYRRDERYNGDRRDDGRRDYDERGRGGYRDRGPPRRGSYDFVDHRDHGGYRYRDGPSSRRRDSPPRDEPMERPRLQLKPRSKPLEDSPASPDPVGSSSIFGGAKPVDTAKREKEIEERLLKKKEIVEKEPKKSYSSIFGGAKPVDTAKKEREIEERLLKQQEEAQKEPSPAKSEGDTTGTSSEEQMGKDTERRRKGSYRDEDREDKISERRSAHDDEHGEKVPERRRGSYRDSEQDEKPFDKRKGSCHDDEQREKNPEGRRRGSYRDGDQGERNDGHRSRSGKKDGRSSREHDDRPRDDHDDRPRDAYHEDRPRDSYRDDRPRDGYRDDRPKGSYRDDRPRDGYRDDRPRDGYRDDRPRDGYRDDRPRDGYRDDRPRDGYRDDRPRDGYRDDRPRDGYRDDRPRDGHHDDRLSDGYYDDRSRDGYRDERPRDDRVRDSHRDDRPRDGYRDSKPREDRYRDSRIRDGYRDSKVSHEDRTHDGQYHNDSGRYRDSRPRSERYRSDRPRDDHLRDDHHSKEDKPSRDNRNFDERHRDGRQRETRDSKPREDHQSGRGGSSGRPLVRKYEEPEVPVFSQENRFAALMDEEKEGSP